MNLSAKGLVIALAGMLLAQFSAAQQSPPAGSASAGDAASAGGAAPAQHDVIPGDPGSTVDKHAFGVLPNYRTANGYEPFRPITTKQKFTIATKDTFDGPSYALATAFAGLGQLTNQNPSFGQGFKGYAHRYGTAIADQDIGNYMTEGILPWMLHEDPRFFRKGSGSKLGRIGYAAARVLITHTDSGGTRFNTSEVLGNSITASIANAYYPDARSLSGTLQRAGTQIGTDAVSDVLKEFWPDVKQWWIKRHHKQDTVTNTAGLGITESPKH